MSIKQIEQFMKFHAERHKVLAMNIENANTPGWEALDIELNPKSFKNMMQSSIGLATTHSSHLVGKSNTKFRIGRQKDAFEKKPNGNNVSIPQQAQKIAANQLMYNTVTEAYMKANALLIGSLGRSGQ
ncbi:MAG: flagellar basal body rod protein [Rickettsiaceae bacterium]|jgi:flagellar basal-body rod protein FlgB|nr:flagellar basal body rod protein [Rickettsiaceae bacterium]